MTITINHILDAFNEGKISEAQRDALLNNIQYKGQTRYFEVLEYIESLQPGDVIYKVRDEGEDFAWFVTPEFYEIILPYCSVVPVELGESQQCSVNHEYYLWEGDDLECLVKKYHNMTHHVYSDAPYFVWIKMDNFEAFKNEMEPIDYNKAMEILASWKDMYEDNDQ